jgi:hypothetical protein
MAAPRPITALLPADSLVVYMARPYGQSESRPAADAVGTSQPDATGPSISSVLVFLSASGLVPDEGQVYADIAGTLPLLGQFEHAVVLLDISSRIVHAAASGPDEDAPEVSLRLKDLQTAVIFRTEGRQRTVLEHVNRIIGRYTNADVADLATATIGGHSYQRLKDERLPGWAVWEWGRLDDFFVVSFGAGAFEKVAAAYAGKAESLAEDPWFRSAAAKTGSDRALAQWFIALSRLEKRVATVGPSRHTRVVQALGAAGMTHDLWTIGREGRVMTWYRCYRRDGQDVVRRYSDPEDQPQNLRKIIPEEARYYGIIRVPTGWLVDNLPRAWLAAQSEGHVRTWSRIWNRLEEETGVDIRGSLIDHLGEHVIIFDYPPHPLRIPFALTIAIEIDNPRSLQMATDTLLAAWSRYLDERADQTRMKLVRLKVRHQQDGVWYLQAGIPGPALKVTDRYLLLSWSPQALRDAVQRMESAAAEEEPCETR